MPILSSTFVNFRNLQNASIDFSPKENFFVGENGQGKTNLLETIYLSAYGNSFRTRNESEIIKNGEKFFSVKTHYKNQNGLIENIFFAIENGKKHIEKNAKKIRDRKDLIETMPCVLFCHSDMDFVIGEPERRRFFFDQSISMHDVIYIENLRKYKKILKNRNQALKERIFETLDVYDFQLAQNGLEIQKKRFNAIFKFNQIFTTLYEKISGIEGVSIKYLPSWKKIFAQNFSKQNFLDFSTFSTENFNSDFSNSSDFEIEENENSEFQNFYNLKIQIPSEQEILQILLKKREKDKILGTTISGPHRDKIVFVCNGKNFLPISSTGQRRLIALVLRISQAIYFSQATKKKPILLMDDVLLELDPEKRKKVSAELPEYDQLFCTFLPGEPYENYKKSQTKIFSLKNGAWNE